MVVYQELSLIVTVLWRPETSLFGCQGNLINKYHQCSCWLSWVSCKLGSLVGKCLDCACLQVSVMQWESSLKSFGTCSHLSCYHGMLYLNLLVTTKQECIVDTQKERRKESKHNTEDHRWATRGECSCSLGPDSKQGSVMPPELFCFSRQWDSAETAFPTCPNKAARGSNWPACADFSGSSDGKESACNAGDTRDMSSISGLGKSPGEGNGNPLQDSCLENSIDSPWGCKESDTTEQLTLGLSLVLSGGRECKNGVH